MAENEKYNSRMPTKKNNLKIVSAKMHLEVVFYMNVTKIT